MQLAVMNVAEYVLKKINSKSKIKLFAYENWRSFRY
jgi:hypothetical protein